MSGVKNRIAALERRTGIGGGEMEIHNSATCDQHLNVGEVVAVPSMAGAVGSPAGTG